VHGTLAEGEHRPPSAKEFAEGEREEMRFSRERLGGPSKLQIGKKLKKSAESVNLIHFFNDT